MTHCFQRKRAEDLARAVERDALGNIDAESLVDVDADPRETLEELGMRDDAGAAADQIIARVLEHVDIPAVSQQQIRREEPAERSADNQRVRR